MQPFRFLYYFTAAGVKCRVAAVKRLPVLDHSAEYVFIFFFFGGGGGGGGIIEHILVI